MYTVYLVDDEQLVLSGIKYMLDWQTLDCQVVGTASNGQDALEGIRSLCPDIVICDISMPVHSGIELLEIISQSNPEVAFIMLTNYQDFALVQGALRHGAVDYLLKTGICPEQLTLSIEKAKKMHDKRSRLYHIDYVEKFLLENDQAAMEANLMALMRQDSSKPLARISKVCQENGIFFSFALARVYVRLHEIQAFPSFSEEDCRRALNSAEDVIRKLASSLFARMLMWPGEGRSFVLCLSSLDESYPQKIAMLGRKLPFLIKNVTGAGIAILSSGIHNGSDGFREARKQLLVLENRYFHTQDKFLFYEPSMEPPSGDGKPAQTLSKEGLTESIMELDPDRVRKWFSQAELYFSLRYVDRKSAVQECILLFNCASTVLSGMPTCAGRAEELLKPSVWISRISMISTHEEMVRWLEDLCRSLCDCLKNAGGVSESRDYVKLAQQYVQQHLMEKISLADVSAAINLSPNYLSSLFKKNLSINFVDYVNQKKMKRACELLKQKDYMFYEIANMLHYESPYYFTKTFQKYVGCTPKEYRLANLGDPEKSG